MNIVRKGLLLALCCLVALTTGCGQRKMKVKYTAEQLAKIPDPQRNDLPAPTGGLVLSVNGETLSAEEVIAPALESISGVSMPKDFQSFAKQIAPHIQRIIKDKITTILLYQKAKIKLDPRVFEKKGPLDKAVDKEIKQFIADHNSDYYLAQQELKKDGYTWKTYREYKKKIMVAQSYFSDTLADLAKPSYTEIKNAYEALKQDKFKIEAKLKFQVIDLKIDASAGKDKETLIKQAKEILSKAKAGEDFTELVKKYSAGVKASNGGIWQTSSADSLNPPYDAVAKEASKTKVGEIGSIVETENNIFIVKTLENSPAGYIAFDDVSAEIERRLFAMKRQQEAEKLLYEMFKEANIVGLDGFINYCIRETYLRSMQ